MEQGQKTFITALLDFFFLQNFQPPGNSDHNPKMEVLQKTFRQVILAAKWLVRHSSTTPQQAATTFAFRYVFI